jgi:hypothetical protein
VLSNFRHDGKQIVVPDGAARLATGRRKLGALLGDGVKTGCNSVLHPGVIVGRDTEIYPLVQLRAGIYPARSIVKLRRDLDVVTKRALSAQRCVGGRAHALNARGEAAQPARSGTSPPPRCDVRRTAARRRAADVGEHGLRMISCADFCRNRRTTSISQIAPLPARCGRPRGEPRRCRRCRAQRIPGFSDRTNHALATGVGSAAPAPRAALLEEGDVAGGVLDGTAADGRRH